MEPRQTTPNHEQIATKLSSRSVAATLQRLLDILTTKGLQVFSVIDQSAEARKVGLDLRDTVLVIFGDPRAGTPVMVASPLAALDLPLKILIWDDSGQTTVNYESPRSLATRYQVEGDLISRLEGINALTDALVARA